MGNQVLGCNERPLDNGYVSTKFPVRGEKDRAKGDLTKWAEAWGKWESKLMNDLCRFLDSASSSDFKLVNTLMVRWGEERKAAICLILDQINAGAPITAAEIESGDNVIVDTTKPPPPPFEKPRD
jgi:hypothetical protein